MVTKKEKKIIEIPKLKIKKKNGLELWWIDTLTQNLALICLTGSKGFSEGQTDKRRQTDAWAMKLAQPT